MKRNKLNFEEISQSMEVLDRDSQRGVKGGLSAAEMLADIAANGIAKYAGKTFSFEGVQFGYVSDTYNGGWLEEVVITATPLRSGSGGGGHGWADNFGLAGTIGDPFSGGAKSILDNRGAYMPSGQIYCINKDIIVRTSIGNINTSSKVLNYVRVGGEVIGVIGVVATGYQVYGDLDDGKYYSAGTRAVVFGVAAGAAFIPVVGWGVSAGIGIADYIWGDKFYNYVENNMQ